MLSDESELPGEGASVDGPVLLHHDQDITEALLDTVSDSSKPACVDRIIT